MDFDVELKILPKKTEEENVNFGTKERCWWSVIACLLLSLVLPAAAQMTNNNVPAQKLPPELSDVTIDQRLDQPIPLDATFTDELGQTVQLRRYFHPGKPVVLTLVYYECPMLCTEVLNSLTNTLRLLKFDVGKQFDVLTVSFDPREKWQLAAAKKEGYLHRYGRPAARNGWHFLVGDEANIRRLTNAVGFHYQWDARMQQFAHATAITVITPEGRIAQYYYGVEYSPKDLRLGLVEASQNRIGTVVDQVLLYCYHYDPRTGKYGAVITNVLKVGGGLTILILGTMLIFLMKHEPKAVRTRITPAAVRRPEQVR